MSDYEELYYALFNRITDVIEELKKIQQRVEQIYLDMTENEYSDENNVEK